MVLLPWLCSTRSWMITRSQCILFYCLHQENVTFIFGIFVFNSASFISISASLSLTGRLFTSHLQHTFFVNSITSQAIFSHLYNMSIFVFGRTSLYSENIYEHRL